jgi:hypothetical protein
VDGYQARGGLIIGASVEEVKRSVSQAAIAPRADNLLVPVLIEEGYRGFNLLRYGEKIYAIPQGEGAFDIERVGRKDYSRWFIGSSLEEVKRLVNEPAKKQ